MKNKKISEGELERYKQKYRELDERTEERINLNNFWFNLPSSDYKHGGYYRDLYTELGGWDTTHESSMRASRGGDEEMFRKDAELHSRLYMKQTPKQFFETIDKVLEEAGIPTDEVKRLINKRIHGSNKAEALVKLYELVLPAYIRLREIGYNRQDLTG